MLKKNQIVYYARIIQTTGIYEVCELKIRTVTDNWFVGVDKRDKHAYLFYEKDIGKTIYFNRAEALSVVKEAEANKKNKTNEETYYEEY